MEHTKPSFQDNTKESYITPKPVTPSSGLGLFAIVILIIVGLISYSMFKKTNILSKISINSNSQIESVPSVSPPTDEKENSKSEIRTGAPTVRSQDPATGQPSVTIEPIITNEELKAIANKQFLGQNDNYAVYIAGLKETKTTQGAGQLLVLNKTENKLLRVSGTYYISTPVIVLDNGVGDFISITYGITAKKNTIVISQASSKQVFSSFCSIGQPTFWNNLLLYGNCTTFENRPWLGKSAPSLVARNLKTGTLTTFLKSDQIQHFSLKDINGSVLSYYRTGLTEGSNWATEASILTSIEKYDLTSLK